MAERKIKRVVVFGGSFSPPTLAHVEIIRRCLALPDVDEVWLVPSGNRTDKQISVSPGDQLAMLKLVMQDEYNNDKRLKLVDIELRRGIATETYDTYQEFLAQHPNTDFWFVFGSDSYATIRTWLNGDWLGKQLPVIIIPRNGVGAPKESPHIRHLASLPSDIKSISSTTARETIRNHKDASLYIPDSVYCHIKDRGLFCIQ
jgi:nicotinate-nucleotide adenylyltransferase